MKIQLEMIHNNTYKDITDDYVDLVDKHAFKKLSCEEIITIMKNRVSEYDSERYGIWLELEKDGEFYYTDLTIEE